MKKNVVIVGAGLVGSLLSIYLGRRGYQVHMYERRANMRREKIAAGRSINLALSDRGILALERVGISEAITNIAIPMHGRYIHNVDGTTAFQPYGKKGQAIYSISRTDLNKKLMDIAEGIGVKIHYNQVFTTMDLGKDKIEFSNSTMEELPSFNADLLFGADGAFSATRMQHQLHHDRFEYSQHYIDCGYKELTIPAGANGEFQMEKNALHIWPRSSYMLIALPNPDGSFTCTLFFPFEGPLSFASLDSEEKLRSFFEKAFPDAAALMPDYPGQFFDNPVSSLVTVKCFPWIRDDKFALIGDAAHAIVPFFGQGMNCGFEDCRILDELITKYDHDWKQVLTNYQQLRKPDADAIAELAIENFIEMREKTGNPSFLLQKKIEAKLHELYPDAWIPAYSQVTFSPQIRYSDALHRGRKQESIMKEIMQTPNLDSKWEQQAFLESIIKRLGN